MQGFSRKWTLGLFAATAGIALAVGLTGEASAQQKTRLTVYTALENDQLGPYKQALEAEVKDVDIAWVRDSTGVITARVLAEKDNPRADVIWGLGASSIALFDSMNLLEGYTPKGAEALKGPFKSTKSPMTWTGMDAWMSVICYNTVEGQKANAPKPATWQDLTKPAYKNQIVMPNPASSGTGYLAIFGWMQIMGEQATWQFLDKLHENVAVYTHSGSAPCVQAARGERMVGLGFDMRGASEKTKGAPIDIVLPPEGAGWDMEATAIIKGTKNLEAAKKLVDWTVTKQANDLYNKYYAIVAAPGAGNIPPNYPADAESKMAKIDLAKMGAERDRILTEWTKRYDGKSAPK